MPESTRTVKLGDQSVTLQEFNTDKFILATDLVAQTLALVPELQDELDRATDAHYARMAQGRRPPERVDRATLELRHGREVANRVSDEAWKASNGTVLLEDDRPEVNAPPQWRAMLPRLLPLAWPTAKTQVLQLAALVATPNSKLEQDARKSRDPLADDGCVAEMVETLRFTAKPSQVVLLILRAWQLVQEELAEGDLADAVGEATTALANRANPPAPSEPKPNRRQRRAQPADATGEPRTSTSSPTRIPEPSPAAT